MGKIKMTEKAYIAVTNLKMIGIAMEALGGLLCMAGVVDEDELKKITSKLSGWQDGLFEVIEIVDEEKEGEL